MPPPTPEPNPSTGTGDSDSEEDYMKMTFDDSAPSISKLSSKPETSLQRRLRLQREGEIRAKVKSKSELAAEAEAARELALRTSLLESANGKKSKGLAMMAKMGFKGGSLGKKDVAGKGGEGGEKKSEPIKIEVKEDRFGIGMESERKRKMDEAFREAGEKAKKVKVDEETYQERVRREREAARLERQVHAAQMIAEKMDEEQKHGPKSGVVPSRPLKSVNVLWRGLVKKREEAERDKKMRRDLEASLSRLPTYEDEQEEEDDKKAMGRAKTVYEVAEDLDEEDGELAELEGLEPGERLSRLVHHLRTAHRYCFWCKFTYPDGEMEGCPGTTEEEHD